ncbi:MAG: hypothetical protein JRN10_04085 [Nitrososphaerota archaeon]|jgi:hypothetical protein|nr:hypothetical protein [Nitrososphaerota archaeon]MDG6930405.1 hypothetical protein [Nitrososphaerota archaeon]
MREKLCPACGRKAVGVYWRTVWGSNRIPHDYPYAMHYENGKISWCYLRVGMPHRLLKMEELEKQ